MCFKIMSLYVRLKIMSLYVCLNVLYLGNQLRLGRKKEERTSIAGSAIENRLFTSFNL